MAEIAIPMGNMRAQMIEKKNELYTSLFSTDWQGKPIWKHISEETLTSVPALRGAKYSNEKQKIMIVGRAVNGWQVPFDDCSSLESTVKSVLRQKNRLREFENESVRDEKTGEKYYYAKSPFLRMMKSIVNAMSGSDSDWSQRIVWSNLFKVAPRDGNNPSWLLVRNSIPIYREILRLEIQEARPDIVIFITGIDYLKPYSDKSKYESFVPLFNKESMNTTDLPENIDVIGSFIDNCSTKMIVCKRPEFREGGVQYLVENILGAYHSMDSSSK